MDIVIPLRKSANDDIELRFALRSIEQYILERGNIFIVGYCPKWLSNIIHIPADDYPDRRFRDNNIFRKITLACDDQRVSDSFCVASDDHFLLKPFSGQPVYSTTLFYHMNNYRSTSTYRNTLLNTIRILPEGSLNFNLHCPIVYNKELFVRSVGSLNWKVAHGYAINSVYCNMNNVEGFHYYDLKIKKPMRAGEITKLLNNRLFFSVDDPAMNQAMIGVLESIYPVKSQYES